MRQYWQKWLWIITGLLIFSTATATDSRYNMPRGVTPISHEIYELHMTIFFICVAIGILVFSVLIYSLIKFRRSKGAVAAHFHESTKVEIIWTVIPFLILVIMAVPATKVLFYMQDYGRPDLTIKVTGYQWKWKYEYLDSGISFFSILSTPQDQIDGKAPRGIHFLREVDHPLVLPVGEKVRFLITSNDAIHSWWVPDFGVKKDAIPGFIQEAWATISTPGTYTGQCSVLCGVGHGFMPIVVKVVPKADFEKWVSDQTAATVTAKQQENITWDNDQLMRIGKPAYEKTCAVCHQVTGKGMPPTFPALAGSKIATGPKEDHIKRVLNGAPGTAMQAFGPQLSNTDIAAIITYERNSWGNDDQKTNGKDAGGIVTPAEIEKARHAG